MTNTTELPLPDSSHPRERYTYRTEPVPNGPGVQTSLAVTVVETATEQGPERVVGTYVRQMSSMYSTFCPFRQLRDETWHDYALISDDYTYLSVMDLTDGAIVAVEQPAPEAVQAARELLAARPAERSAGIDPVGYARTWGFCPVDFFVPDFTDIPYGRPGPSSPTGQFGLEAGCVWGDDSSWKLRYVDLSRISEGIVTTDERFGYVPIGGSGPLSEQVMYWPESDSLYVPVSVTFDRATGAASTVERDDINWADAPS